MLELAKMMLPLLEATIGCPEYPSMSMPVCIRPQRDP
jgi:hypothetical protein